jgi:hypothetical protein
MELQQSFRAVAAALDTLRADQTEAFLARLVLILANEIDDAGNVSQAVDRALAATTHHKE